MKKILLLTALAVFLPLAAHADGLPFGPGERMEYKIYWTVFHAADAVLEVMPHTEMRGEPARYFKATATSAKWIEKLYPVRDTLEAWTDMGMGYSLRYSKDQNEGSYHKKVDLIFDKKSNLSHRYSRGKYSKSLIQPVDVFDPMSILFHFRGQNLFEGMHFKANVSDGKKSVVGEALVGKVETVKTDLGKFRCHRVVMDVKHLSGVFNKSRDASLHVWFTADDRRIPVKVKSKVAVGHFTMELVRYRPPFPVEMSVR
ncbi:MAG: DUF3108 domain-containing protein [Desulfovibrionaceae bacterium]|nr:DUF3108 domain-containing protein [Desulfovibrionaceae bacterium]